MLCVAIVGVLWAVVYLLEARAVNDNVIWGMVWAMYGIFLFAISRRYSVKLQAAALMLGPVSFVYMLYRIRKQIVQDEADEE